MTDKKANEEALIAKYRTEAEARRKISNTKVATMSPLAVLPRDGVITVQFGNDAKPLSALGGVAKVLGRSRISIPEMKLRKA